MKKISLNKILYGVAVLLSVVAVFMIFAPALGITYTGHDNATYTGLQAVFGYSQTKTILGASVTTNFLSFSFMNLLTYILLIVAIVLLVVKLCGKLNSKIVDYIIAVLLVVSGIFFFVTSNFAVLAGFYDATADVITRTLGTGAIVSGVLAIVSSIVVVVASVLKPAKKKRK